MAQEFKQVNIPEQDHQQGTELASEWKEECLGTLTHGDIYRAGLLALNARIQAIYKASKKAK